MNRRIRRVFACFVAAVSAVSAQTPLGPFGANTVPWPVDAGGNGHRYEAVAAPGGIAWSAANAAAFAAEGHLVTLTSAAENAFAFQVANAAAFWRVGTNVGPWIGAFQANSTAGAPWNWVTCEAFTGWIGNAPNNGCNTGPIAAEDFAHFQASEIVVGFPLGPGSANWNDQPDAGCGPANTPWAFIVEYDEFGQANTSQALLAVNGLGDGVCRIGPLSASLPSGTPVQLSWHGPPNAAIALFAGPVYVHAVTFACVGSVDLGSPPGFADLVVVFDDAPPGAPPGGWRLDASGAAMHTLSTNGLAGVVIGLQGLVFQPGACPFSLTAAHAVTFI